MWAKSSATGDLRGLCPPCPPGTAFQHPQEEQRFADLFITTPADASMGKTNRINQYLSGEGIKNVQLGNFLSKAALAEVSPPIKAAAVGRLLEPYGQFSKHTGMLRPQSAATRATTGGTWILLLL